MVNMRILLRRCRDCMQFPYTYIHSIAYQPKQQGYVIPQLGILNLTGKFYETIYFIALELFI